MFLIFFPQKMRIDLIVTNTINFIDLSFKMVQSSRLTLYSCK
jgi:hypothetical protein